MSIRKFIAAVALAFTVGGLGIAAADYVGNITLAADGAALRPVLTFGSENALGLYRVSTGQLGVSGIMAYTPGGSYSGVYSPSLTPTQTSAAIQTVQQTFSVTGLTTADRLQVQGPAPTSLCPMTGARVSAADTLQLDFTVLTAAACTPAAGTYRVLVTR